MPFEAYILPVVCRFGKQKTLNTVIHPLMMRMPVLLLSLRGRAITDRAAVQAVRPPVGGSSESDFGFLPIRFYTRRQRRWYD